MKRNIDVDIKFSKRRWKCISSEAKDLVLRMLEKDPSKRITIP